MTAAHVNLVWADLLGYIIDCGTTVSPDSAGAEWRGRTNKEMLACTTIVPMARPVVTTPGRKLGRRFCAAEAAWILSGDNRVATIAPYAKQIARLSDDGITFPGSYGPPFVDQVSYVVECLLSDPASRQAVITIWRQRPRAARDVPCTVALQWIIRPGVDGTPLLHCVATMRSSDAWMGWVYDVVNFSAMSAFVLLAMRDVARALSRGTLAASKTTVAADATARLAFAESVRLGSLHLTVGSQHLYKVDWDAAAACREPAEVMAPPLKPFDPDAFDGPQALVDHLWSVARRDGTHRPDRWLAELAEDAS